MQIDRMDIDDVGGNPQRLAEAVSDQIEGLSAPVPVREIAAALDIIKIVEERPKGFEGALTTNDTKSEGVILVHADRPESRKRFTIGHELGHYLNPWHKPTSSEGFRCNKDDLNARRHKPGNRAAQMEVEANVFAAELLMPRKLISRAIRGIDLNLDLIFTLADEFAVSREAAGRRTVTLAEEPSAIVFSRSGVVRYIEKHPEFPPLLLFNGDRLSSRSLSSRSNAQPGVISNWEDADPADWLKSGSGLELWEQTVSQRDGFRTTLLSLSDEEDSEAFLDEWEPPTFRR